MEGLEEGLGFYGGEEFGVGLGRLSRIGMERKEGGEGDLCKVLEVRKNKVYIVMFIGV